MQQLIHQFFIQNIFLIKIITFPIAIIELITYFYFLHSLIHFKKFSKNQIISILISIFVTYISAAFVPKPINTLILITTYFLLNRYFFKLSKSKSLIYLSIYLMLTIIIEYLLNIFILVKLNLDVMVLAQTPIYYLAFSTASHSLLILTTFIFKMAKLSFNLLEEIPKKEKIYLILNISTLTIIPIFNLILFMLDISTNIKYYSLYNAFLALIFLVISLLIIKKVNTIQQTKQQLHYLEIYNSSLARLVDLNNQFKHDINNIIFSISGYISVNDMEGLKKYYNTGLLPEVNSITTLSQLNSDIINSPGILGLLLAKYNYAVSKNIELSFYSFIDYTKININEYTLTKILGILMDNAIDAAEICNIKKINFSASLDLATHSHIIEISNTYSNLDIDISKIYEKNFSTKEKKSGIGLYEVANFLKSNSNLSLSTTKTNELFIQKLSISYELN